MVDLLVMAEAEGKVATAKAALNTLSFKAGAGATSATPTLVVPTATGLTYEFTDETVTTDPVPAAAAVDITTSSAEDVITRSAAGNFVFTLEVTIEATVGGQTATDTVVFTVTVPTLGGTVIVSK